MSDYETMQRRRSLIVGLFVIVSIVAFFWLIFKFGDLPGIVSEIKSFEINIQFPTAPGIQRDTPIRFCGYQIGRVVRVLEPAVRKDLNTSQYYFQSVVVAGIDNQYLNKIPKNIDAKMMTRGLGSSYIELSVAPQSVKPGTEFLAEGSLIQGSTGVSSELFPEATQRKIDELISKITILVNNTNDIVGNPENKSNIEKLLANVAQAAQEANDLMAKLTEIANAGKTTLQKADENMDRVANSLVDTSDKLGKVMVNLSSITDKINSGQGTMGKLVNDGRLYEQLLEDSRQIDLILKDLKAFVEESKQKGLPIKLK
jgi:phospholipid/cholesterol/gamma-HCH transport system substrate-binding protein